MSFLAIDGQELPPPKRGLQIIVVTIVDAQRNMNGVTVGQRVGRDQYKINGLEWSWLTASEWERILNLVRNFYVDVTFNDPVSGELKTLKMYCGDRSSEPYWINDSGKPTHYRNCKMNLIDTGR